MKTTTMWFDIEQKYLLFADDPGADPDQGGGGDGGGGEENPRPEYMPEKFWNSEEKTPRVEDLANAYTQLEQGYTRKQEDILKDLDTQRLSKRPESGDKYEFKLPDAIEVPPGFELNMDPDHPLVDFWRNHAWENGYDQEQFENGVAQYVQADLAKLPNIEEEQTKLGEQGPDRFGRVHAFLQSVVTPEEFSKMGDLVTTAAGVTVVEKIMDKVGVPFYQGQGEVKTMPEDDVKNDELFDAKTKRMMAEDGYQNGDPVAIQAVRDRWSRAHPGTIEPQRNRVGGSR